MIDFSNCAIGIEKIKYLSEVFQETKSIRKIKLNHNQIGDEGMNYLSKSLEKNTSITYISLYNNETTNKGTKYVIKALKENHSITSIWIGRLGREDIEEIRKYFSRNKKEKQLKINSFMQLVTILSKI
jgi:hypothetical protein